MYWRYDTLWNIILTYKSHKTVKPIFFTNFLTLREVSLIVFKYRIETIVFASVHFLGSMVAQTSTIGKKKQVHFRKQFDFCTTFDKICFSPKNYVCRKKLVRFVTLMMYEIVFAEYVQTAQSLKVCALWGPVLPKHSFFWLKNQVWGKSLLFENFAPFLLLRREP